MQNLEYILLACMQILKRHLNVVQSELAVFVPGFWCIIKLWSVHCACGVMPGVGGHWCYKTCGGALMSGQWHSNQFSTSLCSFLLSVFCWNHRTEIYLTGDWLFGAMLAKVSQFPLFRGINLDLATCLRPFRTRGSRSGVKVVKLRYGHVTQKARSRDFHVFVLLSFCLFLHCVFSNAVSFSHAHTCTHTQLCACIMFFDALILI